MFMASVKQKFLFVVFVCGICVVLVVHYFKNTQNSSLQFQQQEEKVGRNDDFWTIVLSVPKEENAQSWLNQYKKLGITLPIVIIDENGGLFEFNKDKHAITAITSWNASGGRSTNIIYTNTDTVWNRDPSRFLFDSCHVWICSELNKNNACKFVASRNRNLSEAIVNITKQRRHEGIKITHDKIDAALVNSQLNPCSLPKIFFSCEKDMSVKQSLKPSAATIILPKTNTNKVDLVLMGYSPKRMANYKEIFATYGNMTNTLNKIIFVWNNPDVSPPESGKTSVPITVLRPAVNSLNNRYSVYDIIETDAVLIVDDDVVIIEKLIQTMLAAWKSKTHLLFGLDGRCATPDYQYKVSVSRNQKATIVLSKTFMFHKKYLPMYYADEYLKDLVEKLQCDDIAFNGVVANATNAIPVIIKQTGKNKLIKKSPIDGMSLKPNWFAKRGLCVELISKHFNKPGLFNC